jgi:hypothetical protein
LDLCKTAVAHLEIELSAQISLHIDVRMRLAPTTGQTPAGLCRGIAIGWQNVLKALIAVNIWNLLR